MHLLFINAALLGEGTYFHRKKHTSDVLGSRDTSHCLYVLYSFVDLNIFRSEGPFIVFFFFFNSQTFMIVANKLNT